MCLSTSIRVQGAKERASHAAAEGEEAKGSSASLPRQVNSTSQQTLRSAEVLSKLPLTVSTPFEATKTEVFMNPVAYCLLIILNGLTRNHLISSRCLGDELEQPQCHGVAEVDCKGVQSLLGEEKPGHIAAVPDLLVERAQCVQNKATAAN
eukprot:6482916-Amphidinium_carterae.1